MTSTVSIIIALCLEHRGKYSPIHQEKYQKEIEETLFRDEIILTFGIRNKQLENIICLSIVKFL